MNNYTPFKTPSGLDVRIRPRSYEEWEKQEDARIAAIEGIPTLLEEGIRLMLACQMQWRVGFAGATGLDYNALFSVAGALGVAVDAAILRGIGILESLTLEKWNKRKKED
ncbi:MAG: DUF1799 domain-containing protein [Desulfovibrio sp.]|jgi:hypothetical protein|nr:DUF1799 domain-containing protein [Desulfovibrio sp.]